MTTLIKHPVPDIMFEIKQSSIRQDLSLWIQCTWAKAYNIADNGELIELTVNQYDKRSYMSFRSYNRILTAQGLANLNSCAITDPASYNAYIDKIELFDRTIKRGQIGEMTGRYFTDNKDRVWVEARLLYCDRSNKGWFKENDIWHVEKGVKSNPKDNYFSPDYYDEVEPTNPYIDNKKAANPFGWITIGLGLLSLLK